MNSAATSDPIVINVAGTHPSDFPVRLREAIQTGVNVQIVEPQRLDGIVAGVEFEQKLTILGNLGDYGCLSIAGGEVEVRGNVGHAIGHGMTSGAISIRGHAADAAGAFAIGGSIAILGNAGRRLGCSLQGADIFVRGSSGDEAGFSMKSGNLLIGGNAGERLGEKMEGGTIYVRGDVCSLAEHVEQAKLREADRVRIGLLLLKSGIKAAQVDFKVFKVIA